MKIKRIYRDAKMIPRIYHRREIVYLRDPIIFHVIEEDKLIILGAITANDLPDGLYLDCTSDWVYPVLTGNVLTVKQVYKAKLNGNVLGVE